MGRTKSGEQAKAEFMRAVEAMYEELHDWRDKHIVPACGKPRCMVSTCGQKPVGVDWRKPRPSSVSVMERCGFGT